MTDTATKINIFIAYAREDAAYLKELRKQLRILERSGQVDKIWYDGEIAAGQEWEKAIKNAMETADIFLLLLSADFINSDYCYGVEMEEALAQHEAGTSTIIPVVVRDCAWHYTPLAKIQAPVSGQAITGQANKDLLYKGIIDAIAKVAKATRERKKVAKKKPKVQKSESIKPKQNKEDIKELLLDKILYLQKERILATDASVKFKLEREIADLKQEFSVSSGTTQALNSKKIPELSFPIPEMVFVEGGSFIKGCLLERDGKPNEYEQSIHEISMKDFYIGKYVITNREFCAFLNVKENRPIWMDIDDRTRFSRNRIFLQKKRYVVEQGFEFHPVTYVSWHAAKAYTEWLSEETLLNFRLPTESQWEYAARGGVNSQGYKYSGSNNLDYVSWNLNNSNNDIHPVGHKESNELGVFDMTGNVWEWCKDIWDYLEYVKSTNIFKPDAITDLRVLRGGDYRSEEDCLRISYRTETFSKTKHLDYIGFRIVCY